MEGYFGIINNANGINNSINIHQCIYSVVNTEDFLKMKRETEPCGSAAKYIS